MTRERIITAVNWFLVGLIVVLLMAPTWADDGHGHNHHDEGGDVIVDVVSGDLTGGDLIGGDNSVGGSRSYGVSQSLGDVDINDCLASTQWGIPVLFAKQRVQENPWCMANSLDAMGAHDAAAKLRCTTESIKAIYPDTMECEKAVLFQLKPPPAPEKTDRDDEDYKALRADLNAFKGQLTQAKEDTRKARIEAQRASAQAQTVQTAPNDWEERRAKARAAMKGEE